jgi:hypothetical protein
MILKTLKIHKYIYVNVSSILLPTISNSNKNVYEAFVDLLVSILQIYC